MHAIRTFAVILWLAILSVSAFAVTDNHNVSVNADVASVCILQLNYNPNAIRFDVPNAELTGIESGNPYSYVRNYPESASGVDVTVKSNGKNGVKLEVYGQNDFQNTVNGETMNIRQLKWTSWYGSKIDEDMMLTPNTCFTTDSEGIVTDNITFEIDLATVDALGEYEAVIMFTATHL